MIGLGTMGRNFLLNVADSGFACVGYDLDHTKRELLLAEGKNWDVNTAESPGDLISKLEAPRSIMLLVPAGPIVDDVIDDLRPHLQKDDLIIDGGNSHFSDTERRERYLAEKGIGFLGVGVSGGEEGARLGPSIMPGGKREYYDRVAPILESVSAKVDGEPCVAYMGTSSAGHFVKMVHNGIEYAMMQMLAEAYDIMHRGMKMDHAAMHEAFAEWNAADLESYLVEITAAIMQKTDAETGHPLVEKILDTAGQKGTGVWTSEAALKLGIAIPSIDAAVTMRQISAQRSLRKNIAEVHPSKLSIDSLDLKINDLRDALHAGFLVAYAQGMSLLQAASSEKAFGLDLAEIAKIWRGGCIIRSRMLTDIRAAYAAVPELPSLLLDPAIAETLGENTGGLRKTVVSAMNAGIPATCLSSALAYLDAFSSVRLPANLTQAQRDLFGAHTYQRTDREGTFHTEWE